MQDLTLKEKNIDHKNINKRIWIDVGAHHGERTLEEAKSDPCLIVYAFEPNIRAAANIFGFQDNFIVIPMAIAERDGFATLFLNKWEKASSLLPLDPIGVANWKGNETLAIEAEVIVPTIRLDTFMHIMQIEKVDLLKIDAQGMDYKVVLSTGKRIKNIDKVILEVEINKANVYEGAERKGEILKFMRKHGFALFDVEKQSRGQEENLTFVQCGIKDDAYMDQLERQSELLGEKKEELLNCRIKLKEKREELESARLKLREQEIEIDKVRQKLLEQSELTKKFSAEINAIINSRSWKLMAWLRTLVNLIKKIK